MRHDGFVEIDCDLESAKVLHDEVLQEKMIVAQRSIIFLQEDTCVMAEMRNSFRQQQAAFWYRRLHFESAIGILAVRFHNLLTAKLSPIEG